MESDLVGRSTPNGRNGSHPAQRGSSLSAQPTITDDDLLHLAIAYVKETHGTSPDFLTRVAVVLEALREGRGAWERTEVRSAVSLAPASFRTNGKH
jgi:hypothetical protein